MTPERWQEIEALFHAAQEHAPEDRDAFLASACEGDGDLRFEVESLLGQRDGTLLKDGVAAAMQALSKPQSGAGHSGRELGPYVLGPLLGAGGMGEVYRARDTKLGREVAIKVLARSVAQDAAYVLRFEEEARSASALNHPNIVTIYGVGEEGDLVFIAMELVAGRTLREIADAGRVPIEQTLDWTTQLADALAAAHAGGIAHRDLKPENVMVTAGGLVKVLDFGLARRERVLGESVSRAQTIAPTHTQEGVILGTVGYMSPEQAAGKRAGTVADQFSFGVVLYELLAGTRAFARATGVETLAAIIADEPPPIQTLNAGVSEELAAVIARCLAKDPGQRYGDTRELAAALRRLRGGVIGSVTRPSTTGVRTGGLTRRRALWLAGAAAGSAGIAVATRPLWPSLVGVRSLAVLPFVNVASDAESEYLCDGITESLIQRISRVTALRVMARSTVFNYKHRTIDPREVGRTLQVDVILTGTVARRAGRILISAELIDTGTGARLWGNQYDRPDTDVLPVQDEIASAIVNEGLRVRPSGDERRQLARRPTEDAEAYELYLRGRHALLSDTEEDYLSARALLQQAVARDPTFALAFLSLASTYSLMALDGLLRPTEALPEYNRYVRRALELLPDSADARAALALIAFFFDWDWDHAEREWRTVVRSRELLVDPGLLRPLALQHWALGRPGDALAVIRRAREIDPLSPSFMITEGDYLQYGGRIDESVAAYQKVIQDEPRDPRAYFGLAEARAAQRRFDEAIDARRRGQAAADDDSLAEVLNGARGEDGYKRIERETGRLQLVALTARVRQGAYVSPLDLARAYAQMGDPERSFGQFEAAFADRAPGLVFLNVDRAWTSMRRDARFVAAVRRVGLPVVASPA